MQATLSHMFYGSKEQLPRLHSNHLFSQSREIRIQHEGEEYRLRLTKNNRLILTK